MVDPVWMSRLLAGCCAASIAFAPSASADPAALDPTGNRSGGPVPTVNGVPCVGGNLGVCLSFRQNRPPSANPGAQSIVGHSPTVRR
ncbi:MULTISPECIES: hypothetical protein [unclassified Mycolicibacterium]|uniref:hypothetical protein n=1 Tax=unclassified Mycolicibacterium TaxID=2636767 RepID=UPI0012DD917E|nr:MULTISPECIES: hypothetical protein [unclassified Mycolicibacterium]MUL83810.1 hypothetical protein [Mycolicibacterium sp. CBMA 329]MUL90124.1 hypothetical protein [Mycolicibacterium sp. CBMA 331]MUM26993.1 hypothetical protein [Mycolicibacterium sp. CBMA 295]MUM46725.1 hypothetical protein [Mycolicibacterium sp. CBMA 294]